VVAAVEQAAPQGSNFSYVTRRLLELAERLVAISPASDTLRFCASGTEATMYCQRLARGFTGRDKILKFEGAYHGANAIGVASLFPDVPPDYPHVQSSSVGESRTTIDQMLVAPFNELEVVRRMIAEHASELAAVIVEPLQRCVPPAEGFLEGLREATRHHDVLLIFDEVVTGFRLALGGAQEFYGVVPDLVAYGKALGGGYPIGVYGGRADVMDLVREDRLGTDASYVWSASTLGGNPITAAAASAALDVLAGVGVYEHLHGLGEYLRKGMRRVLAEYQQPAQIIGDGPLAQVVFSTNPVHNYRGTQRADRPRQRDLMLRLFASGVFLNPMGTKLYLSLAHDEAIVDEFLGIFAAALR
jgi:glutamate-1-semialdehyde 2,1-aminomutase